MLKNFSGYLREKKEGRKVDRQLYVIANQTLEYAKQFPKTSNSDGEY
jgi:hypothetical protein